MAGGVSVDERIPRAGDSAPAFNTITTAACRNDLPNDSPDLWWITVPSGPTPLRAMAYADGRMEREYYFYYYFYYYDFNLDRWVQAYDVTVHSIGSEAVSCTGGHTHHAGKPRSRFEPETGQTETLFGSFTTTVIPPVAAGDEKVVIAWTPNEGPFLGDTITSEHFAANRVTGLVRLAAQGNVQLATWTSMHNDIYYVRPGIDRLTYSLGTHFARLDTRTLFITAASLEFGGLYDINNDYSPPHNTHRIGTDVDLDAGDNNEGTFRKIIRAGFEARLAPCEIHDKTHVHCYGYVYTQLP